MRWVGGCEAVMLQGHEVRRLLTRVQAFQPACTWAGPLTKCCKPARQCLSLLCE